MKFSKKFAKKHPELSNKVETKQTTWQELYELWDMYGDDDKVFSRYKTVGTDLNNVINVFESNLKVLKDDYASLFIFSVLITLQKLYIQKKIVLILDCTETMIANVYKFSSKLVLERDFKWSI